jgi:hypothetical protein
VDLIRFFNTAENANKIVGLYSLADDSGGTITEKGIYYFEIDRNANMDDSLYANLIIDTSTQILSAGDYGGKPVEQLYINTFNEIISFALVVSNPVSGHANQRSLYLGYIQNRRLIRCPVSFPFNYDNQISNFSTRFLNDGRALRIFNVLGTNNIVTIGSH